MHPISSTSQLVPVPVRAPPAPMHSTRFRSYFGSSGCFSSASPCSHWSAAYCSRVTRHRGIEPGPRSRYRGQDLLRDRAALSGPVVATPEVEQLLARHGSDRIKRRPNRGIHTRSQEWAAWHLQRPGFKLRRHLEQKGPGCRSVRPIDEKWRWCMCGWPTMRY